MKAGPHNWPSRPTGLTLALAALRSSALRGGALERGTRAGHSHRVELRGQVAVLAEHACEEPDEPDGVPL